MDIDSITVICHNTVMIERNPSVELGLDELSSSVEQNLANFGLVAAQPDHRVAATPDARTIRYYTTLGLLDRPTIQGRQARYTHRHVLQLLAIKALQLTSLPLAEIQSRLYGLSDAELEAVFTSVAASAAANAVPQQRLAKPTYWKEIVIEPGLKLLAEESWSPNIDPALLIERLKVAIASLQISARPTNGGTGDVHTDEQ